MTDADPYIEAHRDEPSPCVQDYHVGWDGERMVMELWHTPRGFARYLAHKYRHDRPPTEAEIREERRRKLEALWEQKL